MTIILSAGNEDQLVQFSDRRLTNGKTIITEHSNKSTLFICGNARASVGYTGLAQVGNFRMQDWLSKSLYQCSKPDFGFIETADRIARAASNLLMEHADLKRLSPANKRLTILMSGYMLDHQRPTYLKNIMITNFQDFIVEGDLMDAHPEFWICEETEREDRSGNATLIQRVGNWPAMNFDDATVFRRLLESRASLDSIVNAGVGLIRRMSDRPEACGSIGKEIAATIIPKDITKPPSARIFPYYETNEMSFVDEVVAVVDPAQSRLVSGVKIRGSSIDNGRKAFGRRILPNDRCGCGSGLKFKRCHGQRKPSGS